MSLRRIAKPTWFRLLVVAVVSVGALGVVPSQWASANNNKPRQPGTIVLVHGAWADASGWSGVVEKLQDKGYTVLAPANPLRGLASDAAYLSAILASPTVEEPITLVGHSYGGAVITNAATTSPKVKALVYVDAFVPAQGESVVQLAGADSALAGDPASVFNFVAYPGAPAGDFDLYVLPTLFRSAFANDLPSATRGVLAASQRPVTFSALTEPSGVPAWESLPSWYLVGTKDNVLPPAQQHIMAARAHAQTVESKASHLSMVSHPGAVTDLILDAARSVD